MTDEINGVRITRHESEFFVAAKRPGKDNYKQDSMHHTPAAALARAAELLGVEITIVQSDTNQEK